MLLTPPVVKWAISLNAHDALCSVCHTGITWDHDPTVTDVIKSLDTNVFEVDI